MVLNSQAKKKKKKTHFYHQHSRFDCFMYIVKIAKYRDRRSEDFPRIKKKDLSIPKEKKEKNRK